MSNAIATQSALPLVTIDKKGTQGSFALAMAFASREQRAELGVAMYEGWLKHGNFQAILNDVRAVGILTPVEFALVEPMVEQGKRVSKDQFVEFCRRVEKAINAKNDAKLAKGKSVSELKGRKAFVYGVVRNIVKGNTAVGEVLEG